MPRREKFACHADYIRLGSALMASVAGGTDADFTGCTALSRHSADGVLRAVCDGAHGGERAAHDSRLPLKAPSLVVLECSSCA